MRYSIASVRRILLAIFTILIFSLVTASAAPTEKVLYSFNTYGHGFQPSSSLISDAAGNLYGTTIYGGSHGLGTVYRLTQNTTGGWTESVLYDFKGGNDGYAPGGALSLDAAGNLYGASSAFGVSGGGTIFELIPTSHGAWMERNIYIFKGGSDGTGPAGGLVFDHAGKLYGTTGGGPVGQGKCGTSGCGTAFQLTPGSTGKWTKKILYVFQGESDGSVPSGGLVFDRAGALYGTTRFGGLNDGVVFRLVLSLGGGWSQQVLYDLPAGSIGPGGGVVFDQAGNLYGTTLSGGSSTGCNSGPCGAVFKLTPESNGSWTATILYSFQGGSDGDYPQGNLTFDQGGNLYGTTRFGGNEGTVFRLAPGSNGGWTESVLWSFTGGRDGGFPESGVSVAPAGQVYGTTTMGGGSNGNGTVFELVVGSSGQWEETTLTNFPPADGGGPQTSLILDASGSLYGTASKGGARGFGTVFKLTPSDSGAWKETLIYSFSTGLTTPFGFVRGAVPSSLIFDSAGNLYGETANGGTYPNGTVFELSPSASGGWTAKDLYEFKGGQDGAQPSGGLIFDQAGNLYGTTRTGGGTGCNFGCGTVFELIPGASGQWTESVLHQFGGGSDGSGPTAGMVLDQAGNLYGTTVYGGRETAVCGRSGCGTVFRLAPSASGWKESILHSFTHFNGDGGTPPGGVILDQAGNLYGTTAFGGSHSACFPPGCGIVFELSPSASGEWTESVLYSFKNGQDGVSPQSGLLLDAAGNLYGSSDANVFELTPVAGGGWSETVLHIFNGGQDGILPEASLIMDSAGNLYGTTADGGASLGGTVFEITP